MNKRYFTFLLMLIVVGVLFTSCRDDDDDAPVTKIGVLYGDDAEANERVKDVRLTSVKIPYPSSFGYGSLITLYTYGYTGDGNLKTITAQNWTSEVNEKNIITRGGYDISSFGGIHESYVSTMELDRNRIVSLSSEGSYAEDTLDYTYSSESSFSYNRKGQLSSCKTTSERKGTKGGEPYSFFNNSEVTFNYSSDHRLLSIKAVGEYTENEVKSKENYIFTCEYDSTSVQNTFYQYTYGMMCTPIYQLEGYFYVGLLGKASSYIPSRYTYSNAWTIEGGETDMSSSSRRASVRFDDLGKMNYHDGKYYGYSDISELNQDLRHY